MVEDREVTRVVELQMLLAGAYMSLATHSYPGTVEQSRQSKKICPCSFANLRVFMVSSPDINKVSRVRELCAGASSG